MTPASHSETVPRLVETLRLSHRKASIAIVAGLAIGGLAWAVAPTALAWAGLPLALALAWASMVDIDRFILPDLITLGLVLFGLFVRASEGSAALLDGSIGAASGYMALASIAWGYERIRKRSGLGLGDAKLLAAAGAWLGWKSLALVVLAGSACALIAVLAIALWRGRTSPGQAFPFGPFLALAFIGLWIVAPWPFG